MQPDQVRRTIGVVAQGSGVDVQATGQEEALIGAVQFVLLPLTFASSAFLASNLIPHGIRVVSDFNPLNWAVVAGRAATSTNVDWGTVASRAGFLAALMAVCLAFATRAFRAYQKSV